MIIIGIKEDGVREKLLENEETTLEKVIECCVINENSRKNLQYMKDKETATKLEEQEEIDAINKQATKGERNDKNRRSNGAVRQRRETKINQSEVS